MAARSAAATRSRNNLERGSPELKGTTASDVQIEALLEYRFVQVELLARALTHRSVVYEKRLAGAEGIPGDDPRSDNEQLEFLGDAVVGLLVADDLCRRYPDLREGDLTRLRAELVSRRHLGEVALRLNLGAYLQLGRGEERSGGRKKPVLLANCLEAVIAALYLDGGLEAARAFILREIIEPDTPNLRAQLRGAGSVTDSKSTLQELLQARDHSHPEYVVKAESGPDHRKRFLVEVFAVREGVRGKPLGQGLGASRKKAEQEAARCALDRFAGLETSK